MENEKTIQLHCFFCGSSQFDLPGEDYQPKHGEQIRCANCGRTNDYDSLMRVAKRKGEEWAKKQVQDELDKFKKELGKMFK